MFFQHVIHRDIYMNIPTRAGAQATESWHAGSILKSIANEFCDKSRYRNVKYRNVDTFLAQTVFGDCIGCGDT